MRCQVTGVARNPAFRVQAYEGPRSPVHSQWLRKRQEGPMYIPSALNTRRCGYMGTAGSEAHVLGRGWSEGQQFR